MGTPKSSKLHHFRMESHGDDLGLAKKSASELSQLVLVPQGKLAQIRLNAWLQDPHPHGNHGMRETTGPMVKMVKHHV